MCGRYVISIADWNEFSNLVSPLGSVKIPDQPYASYNVSPTHEVPALRSTPDGLSVDLLEWGLIPFFAKGIRGKYSTINVAIETMAEKPSYRGPWKRGQRCIMLASGFYEWQTRETSKQPYLIRVADQPIFGFAALWDRSIPAEGEPIDSCTIVTMSASPLMATIHNTKLRMPAILAREDWQAWLTGTPDEAKGTLKQYPDDCLNAHPVSTRVNSPKNNDAACIESLTA